jgi:penicillin-binding protein 2
VSELTINPGVELRNSRLEIYHFRLRLAIASGFVLCMFFLLFVRFFYLQVVQHDYYSTLAEANRISIAPIVPNRGIIVDRNGVLLANNYSAYTLEITPRDRRRFKKLVELALVDASDVADHVGE